MFALLSVTVNGRRALADKLHLENLELRELLHHLSTLPEPEAYDIFQRLRLVDDPIDLALSIRQAELLLPIGASEDSDKLTTMQGLEFGALGGSPVNVPARPWTTVAGDGIVSELISAWFKWDTEPQNAKYCSPFLVNAICALRSYFSETVDTIQRVTKQDMREQFLSETKKQYDHGLPALPAIQGLCILFAISCLKGEDRDGSLYRFASYGMLERFKMKQTFSSLTDTNPESVLNQRAISKTMWGVFCLESIISTNFRHPNILQPPKVPCPFPEFDYKNAVNVDIFGETFTDSSPAPPFVTGAINVFCQVAMLMSDILTQGQDCKDNEDTGMGDRTNLIEKGELMARLNAISDSLPSALRHDYNFTPETCFLRIAMNTAVHAILRPLHPRAVLDEMNGMTVKSLMLKNCALDIELMERYFEEWPTGEFSTMVMIGPLKSGAVLLPLLPDEEAVHMFPRVCRLMRKVATRMPIARYVMKGWETAIWSRELEMPGPAQPYFQNLGAESEDLQDIPTRLVVAHIPSIVDMPTNEWDDGELGFLLQKCNARNIE
ncbi:hypothetical protein E0Z10_g4206 [Xylaria hypoxylon]|uniref:Xylanolytic transcriptional activator regulatory domain-containing protein n=1 Tax=Xylaria hypoxylon TaxID=37992 RepID=A0A4Z0YLQ1_9PEZI|nr:hypothetical protein E0Z10_g4206 [Xylaria hypoxylon]